jgi:signal transduction histidine kinase
MAPDGPPEPARPDPDRPARAERPPRARPSVRAALMQAATGKPREEVDLEHGLLTAIAAFRTAAWAWAAIVLALNVASGLGDGHPLAGALVLAAALAWTAAATVLVRRAPGHLLSPWAIAVELAVATAMVFVDWWVYGRHGHAQALGTVWPLAVVLTVGVARGGAGGLMAGLAVGLAAAAGEYAFLPGLLDRGDRVLAVSSGLVLYALSGAVAGFLAVRLRRAERRIAMARARDEVARTLHDGVLQTLAIVQRRATDADLVALAREQEHELREFLFSVTPDAERAVTGAGTGADPADLSARLRAVSIEAERRYGLRSAVVVPEPPTGVPEPVAAAVAGAVSEALTNAAKHGAAGHATVYAEPGEDGGLFCSVKDDGHGFDPASTPEGVGLSRSIRGRLAEVGGSVSVESRPGRGAEVIMKVPGW